MRRFSKLLGGLALVAVPQAVHAVQYMGVGQAQAIMFPGEALTPLVVTLSPAQIKAVEAVSGVRVRDPKLQAWRASSGGVLFIDRVLGKHEFITWALALDRAGRVKQIEILDYRETYGDQIRLPKWRAQFTGKSLSPELALDKGVANIAGATLSCRHITDGVRRLLATYAALSHA